MAENDMTSHSIVSAPHTMSKVCNLKCEICNLYRFKYNSQKSIGAYLDFSFRRCYIVLPMFYSLHFLKPIAN